MTVRSVDTNTHTQHTQDTYIRTGHSHTDVRIKRVPAVINQSHRPTLVHPATITTDETGHHALHARLTLCTQHTHRHTDARITRLPAVINNGHNVRYVERVAHLHIQPQSITSLAQLRLRPPCSLTPHLSLTKPNIHSSLGDGQDDR